MKTSPEDTVSFFGAQLNPPILTTHTVPNATGSTKLNSTAYPHIEWPQYNPDLEPWTIHTPKITGPQVTLTPAQQQQVEDTAKAIKHDHDKTDGSGYQYYPKRLNNTELQEKLFSTQERHPEDQKNSTTAIKHDQDKTDWSLMPWDALAEINAVLEFGAKKYAAHNWQLGTGFKYTRVLNSLLRHVFAYMRGEDLDPESGLSHIAHAGCNVLFLLHYHKNKSRYNNDDRHVP